jgi:hypothetical protein
MINQKMIMKTGHGATESPMQDISSGGVTMSGPVTNEKLNKSAKKQ